MKNPGFKSLLHNSHFTQLWGAQMLSQFSIQIISFYILTRIFLLTESTIAVSLMWVAGSLPALVFGPFAGAVVDNFSRRRLLITSALFQSLIVCSLLIINQRIFFFYIVVFMYWFFDQVYYPSQQATVPSLIPRSLLPQVNGLFLLTQQASIAVGFGLGGILLKVLGNSLTILFAAINLILAAYLVSRLPIDRPESRAIEKGATAFFQDFIEGYSYVKTHPLILSTSLTIICSQVVITIISTSLPSFTHQVLRLTLTDASLYIVTPAALGALVSITFIPGLIRRLSKSKLIQFGWLVGGLALIGLSLIGILPTQLRLPAVMLTSSILGLAVAIVIVPAQSLLQEQTPDHLRGRIFGQLGFLMILATTLPLITSAAIADLLGITSVIAILGLLLLSVYFLSRLSLIFKKII